MELFYISIVVALALLIYLKKSKSNYSKESLQILKENFNGNDFSKLTSIEEFKDKLDIKKESSFKKSTKTILNDAEHKIEILYNYRIEHKLLYNEVSFLKVTANCVIDYCIRKEYDLKQSIKTLFMVLNSPEIEKLIGEDANNSLSIENFLKLLEGFVQRYKKKMSE